MKKIRKRSPIPFYGTAIAWVLCCFALPVYKLSSLLITAGIALVVYAVLSKFFPGETVEVKEPVTTGVPEIDALLREGENVTAEMRRLRDKISSTDIRGKVDEIINLTEKIYNDLADDPSDLKQVRRFSNYYVQSTLKLLRTYVSMQSQNVEGKNISGTLSRIESVLDTIIAAYKKQLDALFANQSIDIDTDITVLETIMKREGLL